MDVREAAYKRRQESICEVARKFDWAVKAGDWKVAEKAFLASLAMVSSEARERRVAEIEAAALDCELRLYRPARDQARPAPQIKGHCYVVTARQPFICGARKIEKEVFINEGGGYLQCFWVPDQETICGRKTAFPHAERFTSGGWPRLHELCPDCAKILGEKGLLGDPEGAQPSQGLFPL